MRPNIFANHKALELIKNESLLATFSEFAKMECLTENTKFLQEYRKLKQICDTEKEGEKSQPAHEKMNQIYLQYIAKKVSIPEINISSEIIEPLRKEFENKKFTLKSFTTVADEIISLLNGDSYARFLMTSQYQTFQIDEARRDFQSFLGLMGAKIKALQWDLEAKRKTRDSNVMFEFTELEVRKFRMCYAAAKAMQERINDRLNVVSDMDLSTLCREQIAWLKLMTEFYLNIKNFHNKSSKSLKVILEKGLKELGVEDLTTPIQGRIKVLEDNIQFMKKMVPNYHSTVTTRPGSPMPRANSPLPSNRVQSNNLLTRSPSVSRKVILRPNGST